jgi:hypothetical protein
MLCSTAISGASSCETTCMMKGGGERGAGGPGWYHSCVAAARRSNLGKGGRCARMVTAVDFEVCQVCCARIPEVRGPVRRVTGSVHPEPKPTPSLPARAHAQYRGAGGHLDQRKVCGDEPCVGR